MTCVVCESIISGLLAAARQKVTCLHIQPGFDILARACSQLFASCPAAAHGNDAYQSSISNRDRNWQEARDQVLAAALSWSCRLNKRLSIPRRFTFLFIVTGKSTTSTGFEG